MSAYQSNHQSPMGGPSPGGYGQPQGGYGGPGMAPQGYGNVQMPGGAGMPRNAGMPGSAGGYGRDQHSGGGYGPPSAGGYPSGAHSNYGGYQG